MRITHAIGPSGPGGRILMLVVGFVLTCCPAAWASSEPAEVTNAPTFKQEGEKIVASLMPWAKSTQIQIGFDVAGGRLEAVTGKPFKEVARPEVDHKDFKSGLFVIQVTHLPPGAAATVSLASDFFSSSTEYWCFNAQRDVPWTKAQILNEDAGGRVRKLSVTVTDGGPLDADNTVDGRITLVGGAKDSFWGYALGTLAIRFFGIFLVLSVLMAGMMGSGKIFEILDKRRVQGRRPGSVPGPEPVPFDTKDSVDGGNGTQQQPDDEIVAALSAALHIHFSRMRAPVSLELKTPAPAAWTLQGRQRAMGSRCFGVSNRNP